MSKNRFDFYEKSSLINISNEKVQRTKLVLSEKYLKKLLFFIPPFMSFTLILFFNLHLLKSIGRKCQIQNKNNQDINNCVRES